MITISVILDALLYLWMRLQTQDMYADMMVGSMMPIILVAEVILIIAAEYYFWGNTLPVNSHMTLRDFFIWQPPDALIGHIVADLRSIGKEIFGFRDPDFIFVAKIDSLKTTADQILSLKIRLYIDNYKTPTRSPSPTQEESDKEKQQRELRTMQNWLSRLSQAALTQEKSNITSLIDTRLTEQQMRRAVN